MKQSITAFVLLVAVHMSSIGSVDGYNPAFTTRRQALKVVAGVAPFSLIASPSLAATSSPKKAAPRQILQTDKGIKYAVLKE